MLEFGGMRSTPSLLYVSGQTMPGVVAPEKVLFIGKIELFDF